MAEKFISIALEHIQVGQPLPANLYLSIDSRFITFRVEGDIVDRNTYDKLEFKKVANLFVQEKDLAKFTHWGTQLDPGGHDQEKLLSPSNQELAKSLALVRADAHRKTLDIFQSNHPDQNIALVMASSKKLVAEVMRSPYAVQTLGQLQSFSRGTVDHSINVSILSIYLAMQMGYSHTGILQHVALGGLLHDIGKRKIDILDSDSDDAIEAKMKEHPTLGFRILEGMNDVPNEVKMIVAQHHERHDGTGFPKKLRSNGIYDLARIVAIANVFDELVSAGKGNLVERQKNAVMQLDRFYFNAFEPEKHDKAVRILKLGI